MKRIVKWRIAGLILLFTFIAFPMAAQTDPPEAGERPELNEEQGTERPTLQEAAPRNTPLSPTSLEDPSFRDAPQSDPANISRRTFRTNTDGDDSLRVSRQDTTTRVNADVLDHSPTRAMFYSLALPGLGQAYNKKYYKIPIVYGVLGSVGYWIHYNTQGYRAASDRYAEDQSSANERYLRLWRRNLELSYITMAGAYALQVLDAYVDAHLFYWDVSPELTLRVEPDIRPQLLPVRGPVTNYGLKCSLTF
ncbi:MAG: DUF5683 domain-containing protein [Bacteroidales bacterium]|nr:DUF5683 domain-containing protein [Bacteroidales bacterium]MDT8432461.1 DUF5683 domain-containing protein [Bacteroidales bacterium]